MKMAAAEALWDTQAPASFSIFTVGTPDGQSELFSLRVPHLLSFMATGDFNGEVEGITTSSGSPRGASDRATTARSSP